jgi:hypothetical protein
MMRTVVLDTNVLLSDPSIIFAYPDAEVIIPETVLGEIDKLKTSRVDPDLRFRGREVSRTLFELSEEGSLVNGLDLPDGGRLRVVPLETEVSLPEGMSTRNPDDRILAIAYQVCSRSCEEGLTLVTNDLNMLLKAQTLGLKVERRGEGDASLGKRTIRWFGRYRVPLTILAIALAVFAGVVILSIYTSRLAGGNGTTTTTSGVPTEFRDLLTAEYRNLLDGLVALDEDAKDVNALKQVADAYSTINTQSGGIVFAQKGIEYYAKYLEYVPDDGDARTDMAVLYFVSGSTDRAIQEVTTVITANPDHLEANFNLGIFYWQGRRAYEDAARQIMKAVDIASSSSDPHTQLVVQDARTALQQLKNEAAAAGVTLDIDPKYLPEATT